MDLLVFATRCWKSEMFTKPMVGVRFLKISCKISQVHFPGDKPHCRTRGPPRRFEINQATPTCETRRGPGGAHGGDHTEAQKHARKGPNLP